MLLSLPSPANILGLIILMLPISIVLYVCVQHRRSLEGVNMMVVVVCVNTGVVSLLLRASDALHLLVIFIHCWLKHCFLWHYIVPTSV